MNPPPFVSLSTMFSRFQHFVFCFGFGAFFLLLFEQAVFSKDYTLTDIEKVEKKAIENRERFKNWHIRVMHDEIYIDPAQNYDPDYGDTRGKFVGMELYKSAREDYFREDRNYLLKGKNETHTTVLGEKWLYRFGPGVVRQEGSSVDIPLLQMINREKPDYVFPSAYDARTLGFVIQGIRSIPFPLTRDIGSLERKNLSMDDAELNDEKCFKIFFARIAAEDERTTTVWISPSKDYNPVKFVIDFPRENSNSTFDISLDKQQGNWFPSLIHLYRTELGKCIYEYKTQIEVVSLNKKLDPNLFNEKGLNLPIGTLVMMDPEPVPDTYTWDGEKIVGMSGATLDPPVSTRGNTIRYLLIATGLAMICFACFKKYFELRQKESQRKTETRDE